ncbi:hypothetical protein [Lysobacter xanthus]
MTRKLRNSLNALVVTAALSATGAFALAAVPFATPSTAAGASLAVRLDTGPKAGSTRRIRHQLAMPYFSFLPRG